MTEVNKGKSVDVILFDLSKAFDMLKYLDLSGNFITNIEPGSFETLEKLETLIFGEHNYINGTVLDAITSLKSLKTLDLSRADGIFEPPVEIFDSMKELEVLKLSGCSISSLEPGAFASLKNLKQIMVKRKKLKNSELKMQELIIKSIYSNVEMLSIVMFVQALLLEFINVSRVGEYS
ncbi:hypothetical protein RB195_004820 [Necator americanus]|uniref:Leucine Rich repeat-containing domain protein n=1 Tax=Necator americanus TaxID=51031 RepID=A0ABR1BJT9_NECAM